jgi:hypothetical protein
MFGKDLQRKVGSVRRYRIRKESKDRSNKSNHIMRGKGPEHQLYALQSLARNWMDKKAGYLGPSRGYPLNQVNP